MRKNSATIAEMRHKLVICSQDDVVTSDAEFKLVRKEFKPVWASIEQKATSAFGARGVAIKSRVHIPGVSNTRTHVITIRYSTAYNVSSLAWLYEARLKSSPRWFKVLNVGQTEDGNQSFLVIDCALIERADQIATPSTDENYSPAVGLPHGVKL